MAIRYGKDPGAARQLYAELKATREFKEAAARLLAARQAQGLPDKITDGGTLALIASLLVGATP